MKHEENEGKEIGNQVTIVTSCARLLTWGYGDGVLEGIPLCPQIKALFVNCFRQLCI